MTKRLKLMALGLSILLFAGCGAVDDLVDKYAGDDEDEERVIEVIPATAQEAAAAIIGTWETGCNGSGDEEWTKRIIVFNSDNTGIYTKNQYTSHQCDDSELDSTEGGTWNYLVGNKTVGADALEAYELDITDEVTDYFMVRFHEVYVISFADNNDDENIGNTPETRASDFTVSTTFFRTE